jgi:hypothetical protein
MQNKVSKRHASKPNSRLSPSHTLPPSQIIKWKTLKETISRKWLGMPQMARNAASGESGYSRKWLKKRDCPQVGLRK